MIDAVAQAYLQLQFWTTECVKRSKTEPRQENQKFAEWKKCNKEPRPKQWSREGHWDMPLVTEQAAIEQAAQMADRWQKMYFRAIRSLRDWRRYTPQVTINNPNQVNIATDRGQQVNVADFPNN
jgi:seryl-tRNA synthetase